MQRTTSGQGTAGRTSATRRRRWGAVGAVAALGAGLVGIGGGTGTAAADYAPYIVFAGDGSGGATLEARAGDHITFGNDYSGQCDTGYDVPWRFGVIDGVPEIAAPVEFTTVLLSGSVTPDADGNWTVELDLPADLADGAYAVSASCQGVLPEDRSARQAVPTLFDYFPAFIEVGAQATTTTTPPSTTVTVPELEPPVVTAPPPAAALPGNADFTG